MKSIYIVEHSLSNHSGFINKTSLQLNNSQSTIILGINGAGKTSLMNSFYASIMTSLSGITGQSYPSINISSFAITIGKTQSEILSTFQVKNNSIEKEYQIGVKTLLNGQVQIIGKDSNHWLHYFRNLYEDNSKFLPVFRYFQSEKLTNSPLVQQKNYNKLENRSLGYENHFGVNISIQEITSFIIDQINLENQAKIDNKNFNYSTTIGKYIRETINTFTEILYNTKVEVKVGSSKYSNGQSLMIEKNGTTIEFIQLSSGEKYILGMILELIYRNTILNSGMSHLKNTPGIVLIDEVDDHLHPRWQLTIIKALQTCFPNIQFIVSTHSPLVASSVRREQMIVLNNFEVIPSDSLANIYSGSANELLNKILFSDNQVNDYIKDRNEIRALIDEFQFKKAEQKLIKLKQELQAQPEWIEDLERQITFGQA